MRNRKRNWIFRRIALGFAVGALAVPAVAQARVDSGLGNSSSSTSQAVKGDSFVPFATDFPKYENTVKAGDYAIQRGDLIEVVRAQPRNEVRAGDRIENVRLQPRSVSTPQLVSSPGFDWGDAGIGAGLALGLALLGVGAIRATRHLGRAQTA